MKGIDFDEHTHTAMENAPFENVSPIVEWRI